MFFSIVFIFNILFIKTFPGKWNRPPAIIPTKNCKYFIKANLKDHSRVAASVVPFLSSVN